MQNFFELDYRTRLVAQLLIPSNSEGAAKTDKAVTESKTVRSADHHDFQEEIGGKGKDVGNRGLSSQIYRQ